MAPTWRSSTILAETTGQSVTALQPASIVAGDILYFDLGQNCGGGQPTTMLFTPTANFPADADHGEVGNQAGQTSNVWAGLFWMRWDGSSPMPTFGSNNTEGRGFYCQTLAVRDAATSGVPHAGVVVTVGSGNVTSGSLTTTVADCLAVMMASVMNNNSLGSPSESYVSRQRSTTSLGDDYQMSIDTKALPSPVTQPGPGRTGSTPYVTYHFAVLPPSAGGTVNSGTGSSAGASSAAGQGQSSSLASGSSAGSATAVGGGASIAVALGQSAGLATCSSVGTAIAGGAGAAAGSSTAEGSGASVVNGLGSASGTSTAAGVSSVLAEASGSASGGATVLGYASGSNTNEGTGSAAGQGSAQAVGASIFIGAGSAFGQSSSSGTGTAIAAARGDAAGSSFAEGHGLSISSGFGVAIGIASVTGRAHLGDARFPTAFRGLGQNNQVVRPASAAIARRTNSQGAGVRRGR